MNSFNFWIDKPDRWLTTARKTSIPKKCTTPDSYTCTLSHIYSLGLYTTYMFHLPFFKDRYSFHQEDGYTNSQQLSLATSWLWLSTKDNHLLHTHGSFFTSFSSAHAHTHILTHMHTEENIVVPTYCEESCIAKIALAQAQKLIQVWLHWWPMRNCFLNQKQYNNTLLKQWR